MAETKPFPPGEVPAASVTEYGAFGLTYCGKRGLHADPPTQKWAKIETLKDAERLQQRAAPQASDDTVADQMIEAHRSGMTAESSSNVFGSRT